MSSVTSISSVSSNTVRQRVTPEEWEVRVKLAAAYRLAALYKWTDHIYTHFSARVPGKTRADREPHPPNIYDCQSWP